MRWIRRCLIGLFVLGAARPLMGQLSVQVGPDNGTHPDPKIRLANSTGNTVTFTVTNNGTIDAQFTKTCTPIGNVTITTCPVVGLIAAQDFKVVTVTFSVGAAGSGGVQFSVTSTNPVGASAVGKWDETIVAPAAAAGTTPSILQVGPNLSNLKQVYTVTNLARGAGTFTVGVQCGTTGAINCGLSRTTLTLDSAGVAAASDTTTVTWQSGAAGQNGAITVTPSFAGVNLTPSVLSVNVPNAAVTPDGQALATTTGQTGVSTSFQVENTGSLVTIFALSLPTCAPAANCRFQANGLSTLSLQVQPGAANKATVPVLFDTPAAGTGPITLRAAFGGVTLDDGTVDLTVAPPITITATGTLPNLVAPGAAATQSFLVTNPGATAAFSFTHNCASMASPAAATGCTITLPALQPVTIPGANGTTTVTVSFTGGSTQGASSTLTVQGTTGGVLVGTGSATIIVPKATVSTPAAATRIVGNPDTATFTVTNGAPAAATFTFTAVCGGGMTSCQVPSPSSALVAASPTGNATVTVISTASTVGSGSVTLQVRYPGAGGTILSSGIKTVTIVPPQLPMTIDVAGAGVDSMVTRSQCAAAAIGKAAATECGDLRIVHPLPSVRTLQKWRTPTLIYSSAHAAPTVVVAANLTLPATSAAPTGVSAAVVVNGVTRATGAWAAAAWTPGAVRRIVLPFDPTTGASPLATGVYTYTLTVTNTFTVGGPAISSSTGKLVVVDRRASPFGAGWWLAGLEKLDVAVPSLLTWYAGDGSARQYKQRSGSTTIWDAPTVTYPDMIQLVAGQYVRLLPDSVSVWFDAQGKQVKTQNRVGHATSFFYDGSGRLSTITVPPAGGGLTYVFHYDGSNHLSSVDAPGLSAVRVTQVVADPTTGRVTSITDPSAPSPTRTTGFGYAAGSTDHKIRSRTDGRGFLTTFQYDAANKVSRDSLAIPPAFIRRILTNVATQGLAPTAVDTSTVRFRIDGPRSVNTVSFALNAYGAPTTVVDALNHTTRLARTKAGFPGLVTQLTTVTGHTIDATYDTRGRILTSTEPSTAGTATTTFVWDAKWDELTKVTDPTGGFTDFVVNATTGNRDSEQRATALVNFGYDPVTKLVASISGPGAHPEQYTYDGAGNLRTATSARNFVTTYTNDNIGRVARIDVPVGMALNGAPIQTDTITYSDRNEELTRRTFSGADFVNAAKGYDAEGNLLGVTRTYSGSVATLATGWHYDGADRPDQETPPGGFMETRVFDEAGNVTDVTTRRGLHVRANFDALNRDTLRTIVKVSASAAPTFSTGAGPTILQAYLYAEAADDSLLFTFTNDGRILTANNKNASISRTYHSNGVMLTEALSIKNAARTGFSGHTYTVTNTYDATRRRTGTVLTPASLFGANGLVYANDPSTGLLSGVIDAQGFSYSFGYNSRFELTTISYPGLIAGGRGYDADGYLAGDTLTSQGVAFPRLPSTALRRLSVTSRNGRGQILQAGDPSLGNEQVVSGYDGLGRLQTSSLHQAVVSVLGATSTYGSNDTYTYDGLSNRLTGAEVDTVLGVIATNNNGGAYSTATGRLTQRTTSPGTIDYTYDAAGNAVFEKTTGATATTAERWAVFGADEHLLASDTRTVQPIARVFEEYRYDALGRRIWVRTNKVCEGGSSLTDATCHNRMVRRTIWDGDRELAEIQAPMDTTVAATEEKDEASDATGWGLRPCSGIANGCDVNPFFGRVMYGPAIGTDQPISVTRFDYRDRPTQAASLTWPTFTIVPYWNYQGTPSFGTFGTATNAAGQAFLPYVKGVNQTSCPVWTDTSQQRCVRFQWPFARSAYDQNRGKADWPAWHGTVLQNKRDGSGLEYRRNRQYDPGSGRFTQEDPIGLAGGLNLYGFADGDPVNFADPFGLLAGGPCDKPPYDLQCLGAMVMQRLVNRSIETLDDVPGATVAGMTFGTAAAGRQLVTTQLGGAAVGSVVPPSAGMIGAFERQLAQHGRESLVNSAASIRANLAEELANLAKYRAAGGFTSSVEREIRTFRRQLAAIRQILERNP